MCSERLCQKMCEMHKNPLNCWLHFIGIVIVIYALWINSVPWILVGILIVVIGHIIQEAIKKRKKPRKKSKKRKKRR